MIAEMYKRREKLGYVFLGLMILVFAGWPLFQPPETTGDWLEMLVFLLPLGFIFSIIMSSRSHYNKVSKLDIPPSDKPLSDLNHVVIKKDAAVTPRLLLFEKDGKFIGVVKPQHVPWWLLPFSLFNESIVHLFPCTYEFLTHDGETIFTFRKTGWIKQVRLTMFDRENRELGTYIQEELKGLFRIKGRLFNEKQEEILDIHASGFSGDFRWRDEEGTEWAYFYNGKFPHEYTSVFRDSQNDMVELSDQLSYPNKIRLLAVIGYLFTARVKQ
ncbi:hypothetical protein [Salibacterium sp. K-3]